MKVLQQKLYRVLIHFHPPSFCREFAGEMITGFEEASQMYGAWFLYRDVFLSLARQWVLCISPLAQERRAAPHPSLLSGSYVAIAPSGLAPISLAHGLLLSCMLFTTFGVTVSPVTFQPLFGYLHAIL